MENEKFNLDWKKEDEKDKEELKKSDAAKGDIHSSKSDIPLGMTEEEYLESFNPQKLKEEKLLSEEPKEEEEYYDTGIRPHVKLPPDESDEWPVIVPDKPLEKPKSFNESKENNKKEEKDK